MDAQELLRERYKDNVKTLGRLVQNDALARQLFRDIVQQSGVLQASYMDNPTFAQFREGQRSIGMLIVKMAQEADVVGLLLEKEANNG